jgi:hypothetical protein
VPVPSGGLFSIALHLAPVERANGNGTVSDWVLHKHVTVVVGLIGKVVSDVRHAQVNVAGNRKSGGCEAHRKIDTSVSSSETCGGQKAGRYSQHAGNVYLNLTIVSDADSMRQMCPRVGLSIILTARERSSTDKRKRLRK